MFVMDRQRGGNLGEPIRIAQNPPSVGRTGLRTVFQERRGKRR